MFMSVVLPAPFSPSRAWTSPLRTSSVTPSLAMTPGKVLLISLTARRTGAPDGTDGNAEGADAECIWWGSPAPARSLPRTPAGAMRNLCGNVMRIMDVLLPRTLEEALEMKAAAPAALPIAGGTDVMVELNFDRRRPSAILDISRLPELGAWRTQDGTCFLGAGVTYSRIVNRLTMFPALVQASRTVGSPQIRNRGTVGGNLGTASPAGDALPVLAAYDAEVVLVNAGGIRRALPWHQFMVGPKKTGVAPDELILAARWRIGRRPGAFSKVGTRNAMVIAVASLCLL